ncbi:MAG: hypothetical protein JXR89_03895 [Deltaproteobacteria bacterium]|nr:hypothetical protein [Deltaproteobacteria bacterium]
MSDDEWYGLTNNRAILKSYPFIAISPDGLDISDITNKIDFQESKTFCPNYFSSPKSYSRLLLSANFWNSFDYKTLLLAQLDTFVFRDELDMWCQQNYAFIGAPWFKGFGADSIVTVQSLVRTKQYSANEAEQLFKLLKGVDTIDSFGQINLNWRDKSAELKKILGNDFENIYSFLEKKENYFHSFAGVGNGGFSLRRVDLAKKLFNSTAITDNWSLSTTYMEEHPAIKPYFEFLQNVSEQTLKLNAVLVSIINKLLAGQRKPGPETVLLPKYSSETHETILEQLKLIKESIQVESVQRHEIMSAINKFKPEIASTALYKCYLPEDFFWGEFAKHFVDNFTVAPFAKAIQFSFEHDPAYCFEFNNKSLPFGCHAWQLPRNRVFWNRFFSNRLHD